MRFPFVSRSVYDDAVKLAENAQTSESHANHRYDLLFTRYTELVADLVAQRNPPPAVPLAPAEPDLPAEIWQAIGERAVPNTAAYTALVSAAMQMQQEGVEMGVIIDRIIQGEDAPL